MSPDCVLAAAGHHPAEPGEGHPASPFEGEIRYRVRRYERLLPGHTGGLEMPDL